MVVGMCGKMSANIFLTQHHLAIAGSCMCMCYALCDTLHQVEYHIALFTGSFGDRVGKLDDMIDTAHIILPAYHITLCKYSIIIQTSQLHPVKVG